ncbi:hypothetical protein CSA37_13280 [Candidatus Fermentibacteria bacterium]|nr:MAG: hypothetical protein CSA37_13280 [Candidatus Fermentibacteria bacterium]
MRLSLLVIAILSLCVFADTSFERIIADEALTVDQTALYLVYSVVAPERLPLCYTINSDPAVSGSPALHEAMLLSSKVSSAALNEILTLVSRPTLSGPEITFNSPSGHFKFHYTTTGADAVTQAYAEEMAGYFDYSWQIECDSLNYFTPPPDNGAGGDDLYDVYIKELTGETLGYTSSGGEYKPPDSTHDCSASHIAMDIDLGYNHLTTTSSHEFQHAIQNSYDYNEPTWFLENCAVWMEDQVFPDINDWTSFWSHSAVRKPWMDIAAGAPNWYGNSIWPRYMQCRFETDAVREVWQFCADTRGANMWDAQTDMFDSYGVTFEDAFMEYGLWRYFTGPLYKPDFDLFDEDLGIPSSGPVVLPYHNHSTLPASGNQGSHYPLNTRGIHWIKFKLENYQNGWLQFEFDGRDNFEWNLGVFLYNDDEYYFQWMDCDTITGLASLGVNTTGYDYAVFFPAFMSETSIYGNYTYSASFDNTGIHEEENLNGISLDVLNNPMTAGSAVNFTVNGNIYADLSIMDISGRRVSTLFSGPAQAGLNTVEFNSQLPAGTYTMVLRADKYATAQRVSILR